MHAGYSCGRLSKRQPIHQSKKAGQPRRLVQARASARVPAVLLVVLVAPRAGLGMLPGEPPRVLPPPWLFDAMIVLLE